MKCILCNQKNGDYSRSSHTSDKSTIYKCSNCGLEYTSPIPTDNELLEFYSKYSNIRAMSYIVRKNAKRNIDLIYANTKLNNESLFLDFGCGNGEFMGMGGNNFYGVELNKSTNPNIETHLSELKIDKFDCITLFDVLEHLNRLKEQMLEINKYLKKGGYLIVITVDAESLIPYFYKPPEHLTYWTKNSFYKLAELLDLEITYYEPYRMVQDSTVYLDRLLSRTPEDLKNTIYSNSINHMPQFVDIPTNEVFCIMKKR